MLKNTEQGDQYYNNAIQWPASGQVHTPAVVYFAGQPPV